MGGYGVVRSSAHELRDLVLMVDPEPGVDQDELNRLVRQLRAEIKDLDVEAVTLMASEHAPTGAKGVDLSCLGALLITFSATGGVFSGLIEAARAWLSQRAAARRISVTIDGDTIVLEKSSAQERNVLIDAYVRRHEVK